MFGKNFAVKIKIEFEEIQKYLIEMGVRKLEMSTTA